MDGDYVDQLDPLQLDPLKTEHYLPLHDVYLGNILYELLFFNCFSFAISYSPPNAINLASANTTTTNSAGSIFISPANAYATRLARASANRAATATSRPMALHLLSQH